MPYIIDEVSNFPYPFYDSYSKYLISVATYNGTHERKINEFLNEMYFLR